MSRLLCSTALLFALGLSTSVQAETGEGCAGDPELQLVNGEIHTMDAVDTVVSSVLIRDGKFVAVGGEAIPAGECVQTIDLDGKTVVPGLIDNHNHIVVLGLRPGHDTRLENARSIADVQQAIAARAADLDAGEWVTAMGGWATEQLAEKRMPTMAELDAAATDHPVLAYIGFMGPAVANSKGREMLAASGVPIGEDGTLAPGPASLAARKAILAGQTDEDRIRGAHDALTYGASLGLTTNVDMGAMIEPGTPDIENNMMLETVASADPHRMYDPFLALNREGRMPARLRIFFMSMDQAEDFPLTRERVLNQFNLFGDDMLRSSGIGEFATAWPMYGPFREPGNFVPALKFLAERGWAFQQHSLSPAEDDFIASSFEAVNEVTPIADLRWSLAHAPQITPETVERLKAVGAGVAVHPFEFLGTDRGGPPLRMLIDSGVHLGAGSDGAQISTINPWNMISYMVTGVNIAGQLVNADQTISREEALRLYTAANGWFLHEEDVLGTIEPGKYGDLVVLSANYFDPASVPDGEIRDLHSLMTVVGGKIVWQAD